MKRTILSSAVILSLTLLNASAAQHQQPAQPAGMAMMQDCPMKVLGAELTLADTKDGIALTITSKSGDITELRRRAEKMARMHDSSLNAPMKHEGMMPFTAEYEEVPNGARVTLTPKEPAQLQEFQTKVRQHAEQMKKGECSMMQEMMGGMMPSKGSPQEPTPKGEPKHDEADHESHHPKE